MFKFFVILCLPAIALMIIGSIYSRESESQTIARLAGQDQFISSLL